MRLRFLPIRFSAEPPRPGELHGKPRLNGLGGGLGGAKTAHESTVSPQQTLVNGVPDDMASLVMENPGLSSGLNPGRNASLGLHSGNRQASNPVRSGPVIERAEQTAGAELSDAEIMLAVAAGDEAGYNYLVTKYHRQIIHFLYRMVHNEAVAEELAQEVFLRVYRSRESYRAEAKFSTWLYRIATNLAVNHARDTKYERTAQTLELDAPDAESGSMPEVADDDPNVEQRILRE